MKKLILSIFFALIALAGYAQHQFTRWVPTSGTDTYTATITVPSYTAYTNSKPNVKFGNTNTGAATININSIGAIALRMWDGDSWEPLTAGQIDVNTIYELAYTGSYFQMQSFGTGGGTDTNTSFNALYDRSKTGDFTISLADTSAMNFIEDTDPVEITFPDLSGAGLTKVQQFVFLKNQDDPIAYDFNGQTVDTTRQWVYMNYRPDDDTWFASPTTLAEGSGSSSLTSGSGITIDSDSINLRGTLTRNAAIIVPSGKRFEVSRVSGFNFTLNNSGALLSTASDPITISSTSGHLQVIMNGVGRFDTNGVNNNYSAQSGTGSHRFYIPGAGAQVRLMEESGSGTSYIALAAPTNVTTTQTYTFPAAGPSNNGDVLASTTGGTLSWITPASGGVSSVSGTTNRITSTGGTTPAIDISATFEATLSKVAQRIDQNNAATTSAQLASNISDELGTGLLPLSEATVNTQTGNYTGVLSDRGKIIIMNLSSDGTFTIPPAASVDYPDGTIIKIIDVGSGRLTIVEGAAVNAESSSGNLESRGRYSTITLYNISGDDWYVFNGDPPLSGAGSGQYTPTLTNTTNVAASTAYISTWSRIGNVVTVFGKVDIDATTGSGTATVLGLSLPIASALTADEDLAGYAGTDVSLSGRVKADATNDRATITFTVQTTTNDSYSFHFSYVVK